MDLDFWIHQNETSDPHPCKMSWIRYTILDLSLKGQSNEIFDPTVKFVELNKFKYLGEI